MASSCGSYLEARRVIECTSSFHRTCLLQRTGRPHSKCSLNGGCDCKHRHHALFVRTSAMFVITYHGMSNKILREREMTTLIEISNNHPAYLIWWNRLLEICRTHGNMISWLVSLFTSSILKNTSGNIIHKQEKLHIKQVMNIIFLILLFASPRTFFSSDGFIFVDD